MVSKSRWLMAQRAEAEYQHFENPVDAEQFVEEGLPVVDSLDRFDDRRVLEVGAGNGLVYSIPNAALRVGIDPLSSRYASSLSMHHDEENTVVVTGMGESLPFRTGQFDVAICYNALDHARNPRRVLREMHRVLDDGGELVLLVHTFNLPKRVRDAVSYVDRPHPHHFSPEEVLRMIDDAGFEIGDICLRGHEFTGAETVKMKVAVLVGIRTLSVVAAKTEGEQARVHRTDAPDALRGR